jgi:hypothetical protein
LTYPVGRVIDVKPSSSVCHKQDMVPSQLSGTSGLEMNPSSEINPYEMNPYVTRVNLIGVHILLVYINTTGLGVERVQRRRVAPGTETLWIGAGSGDRATESPEKITIFALRKAIWRLYRQNMMPS